jgi:hypothetical protein
LRILRVVAESYQGQPSDSILASADSSNPLPIYADLHNSTVKNKSTDAILPSYQGVNAISDTNLDFHFSHLSAKDLEQNFSHCVLESAKLANGAAEATVQFAKQHPGEVVGTLCLVELCLKNPQIGKAAQEAIESISARAAVGIDDALMMSRKSLKFPVYVVGKHDVVYLDQPVVSPISQACQEVTEIRRTRLQDVLLQVSRLSCELVPFGIGIHWHQLPFVLNNKVIPEHRDNIGFTRCARSDEIDKINFRYQTLFIIISNGRKQHCIPCPILPR